MLVDHKVNTCGLNSLTAMTKDGPIYKQIQAPNLNLAAPERVEPPPIVNLVVPLRVEPLSSMNLTAPVSVEPD